MWVEAIYPDLIRKLATENKIYDVKGVVALTTSTFSDYIASYTNPETPWIVSELNGSKISRLFKFISYSDGDAANKEVKIAIENINPTTKEFDVVVRDYTDTDANPSILERFARCTMNPNDNNYIMRKIGGVNSDADTTFLEDARSSYIYVNVNVNAPIASIPCGFEGYNLRSYTAANTGGSSAATPVMVYKTAYASTDKPLKTYLGISEKATPADIKSPFNRAIQIYAPDDNNILPIVAAIGIEILDMIGVSKILINSVLKVLS
jgi:hypothetical protein